MEQRARAVSCSWATYRQRSVRNRKRPRPIDANESAAAESHPMSEFCDGKRKAVTEIGFGGVLRMPMNGNANLRHTVSLLSRVDLNSRSLPIGKDVRVQMSPEHIERLIGTPSRGRRVCGLDPDTPEERTDFVRLAMGSQRFCNDGLKAAELVVRRDWDGSVTAERVDEFKVAFVVWIVGRFLAPSAKRGDHGCSDFWGSLYNADEIREYNWSAYFLAHIMDAAARVQSDIRNKRATTTMLITGCPLLLQLYDLYLGPLSKPHLVSPSVKYYDSETLVNKMIGADKPPKISAQGEPSFKACGPRRREESCSMTKDPGQPSSSHVLRPGQGAPKPPHVQVTNQVPPILHPYNANDFCEFLKERYPDVIDSELVGHLKFHNARCILHASIFKNSIITENMKLAAKILDTQTQRQRKQQAPARSRVLEDYFTASDSETETEKKRARTHENCWPDIAPCFSVGTSQCVLGTSELQVAGGAMRNGACVNAGITVGKKMCEWNKGGSFSMPKIWQWSDLKVKLPAGLDDCSEELSMDEERWHCG
ncbi:uncharacterized protein LOC119334214 [Triticum dicoccoides]|uniref:uncharacterized protein LOC119334214 n=1 Tax=Triticum dicoccoides TaxID=85692 RepID=UPI0018919542|nr:uncharacterized protein LOC119334214 [Triticum dicoccoides]